MFNSLNGIQESVLDWQEESFSDVFPEASEKANYSLTYISNIIDNYIKWNMICTNIALSR